MIGAPSEMHSSTTEGVRLGNIRYRDGYTGLHVLDGQENAIMILQTVRRGLW